MKLGYLERALAASRAGKPAAIATNLTSGLQSLIEDSDVTGNLTIDQTIKDGLEKAFAEDRSTTVETPSGEVFI